MIEDIIKEFTELRKRLEAVFSDRTAAPGTKSDIPSAGHCAAVALLIYDLKHPNVKLLSTYIDGTSHWFNSISTESGDIQIDLTGDQFGFPAVQISELNKPLYSFPFKERNIDEANFETLCRSDRLYRALERNK